MPTILTIGSINMDLVVRAPRLPSPGETLSGSHFETIPGGKGANQAVAAAKLGARSVMVGSVGDGPFGRDLIDGLVACGVDVRHVGIARGCSSGVAVIHVSDDGENSITIVEGANGKVSAEMVRSLSASIVEADIVALQLEIPLATVETVIEIAGEKGVPVILDPAPVPQDGLPESLYNVDLITPNQSEAERLSGVAVTGVESALAAAEIIASRGARKVVVKLGADGAFVFDPGTGLSEHINSFPVVAVDTTAAGDAFNGALAVALGGGLPISEAVQFGCATGALATTTFGAQPSMPPREAVESLTQRPVLS